VENKDIPTRRWLTAPQQEHQRTEQRVIVMAVLAALLFFVVLASLYQRWSQTAQLQSKPRSLAILPLQNLKQDPDDDFLGFSLADAVITKLDYVHSLSVRPSAAVQPYRNQLINIQKVAADLNVDTLLTGSFIHDRDRLRVTYQLIDSKTNKILSRGTIDLKYEDLLKVQDNVSQQIIKDLELNLSPSEAERIKPDVPVNPLAYEYYLHGVDLYSRGDFKTAIEMLEKCTQIDPNYALSWAQLGRAYNASASFQFGGRDYYRRAQAAFEKALYLQPVRIEARIYMANLLTDTGKVEQSVPLLRNALKTNPNEAEVHWELGYAYRFAGMLEESAAECGRARALDPGVKLNSSALNAYLYLGQYGRFLASLPTNDVAFIFFYRGFGEYYRHNRLASAKNFDHAFELDPSLLQVQIGKAISDRIHGQPARGIERLRETEKRIIEQGVGDPEAEYKIAQAYALLGEKTSALQVLKRSVEGGFFSYPYLATDPLLDAVRKEDEFAKILNAARARHEAFRGMFF
jgi:TolB-like protein/Flp pilus assembly protein TadD